MKILGINGGVRLGYQDVAAAIVVDGQVIAAIEEERLNRIKFSPGMISERSVREVLSIAGLRIEDVDVIATHGSTWGEAWPNTLRGYFTSNFGHCPDIVPVHHHDAHAACAYYASGFEESMILTVDYSGDGISTQLAEGRNGKIKVLDRISRPNSLGAFYTLFTQWCGFTRDSDEYKLMGMAAYGNRDAHDFSWLLELTADGFVLNQDYFVTVKPGEPSPTRQQMLFSEKLMEKLGPKRLKHEPLTQLHYDVAASAQKHLEAAMLILVQRLKQQTGLNKLCLAGGVALNCLANGRILREAGVEEVFVPPAAGDAGLPLGAAWLVSAERGVAPLPQSHTLLGRAWSQKEIEAALQLAGVQYRITQEPAREAALHIAQGKVVGWFQGRSEYGPRALGARSILADPGKADMKDIVNARIKYRESFRPFAPAVTEAAFHTYFESRQARSPYMTITFPVKPFAQEILPATTHADGTARVQTVSPRTQPLFHELLEHLNAFTGSPVVLNTSFNVKGQPIVDSPLDAIGTFFSTGLDVLVIGNCILDKAQTPVS